jgi:hypothetical protein
LSSFGRHYSFLWQESRQTTSKLQFNTYALSFTISSQPHYFIYFLIHKTSLVPMDFSIYIL